MSAFPDTVSPAVPYPFQLSYSTLRAGPYRNKRLVRQAARTSSAYRALPVFPKIHWTNYTAHFDLFVEMQGAAGSFTWFDFMGYGNPIPGTYWPYTVVGVGDASATTFDLPFKGGAAGYSIRVNGVVVSAATYTINAGAGTDGRDQIVFTVAPAAGYLIEAQVTTGRLAVNAHFAVDDLSFEGFYGLITRWGLPIEEVAD